MVYFWIMIKLNIHQAKTHLSRYMKELLRGETIILCKRNAPVAEIRPIPAERVDARPAGLARGTFQVPDTFFEPLPADMLNGFYGASA